MMAPPRVLEVLYGFERAINQAPHVGFEQVAHVLNGHVDHFAVDGHAGIVHPGIEAAEPVEGGLGNAAHVGLLATSATT